MPSVSAICGRVRPWARSLSISRSREERSSSGCSGLADIAGSSSLQRAGYVDVVVVHAQNQDARLRIRDLQARNHLCSAEAGQIQIENDQGGPLFSECIQSLSSVGRFAEFGGWFEGEQPPQPGAHDRVIVDDQN